MRGSKLYQCVGCGRVWRWDTGETVTFVEFVATEFLEHIVEECPQAATQSGEVEALSDLARVRKVRAREFAGRC